MGDGVIADALLPRVRRNGGEVRLHRRDAESAEDAEKLRSKCLMN
jgi:hypothetical protein